MDSLEYLLYINAKQFGLLDILKINVANAMVT